MKILKIPLLCFLLAFCSMQFAGCKSPETVAYKVTGATVLTVDAAMNAWGDYVRAGRATDAQQAKVREVYGKYLAAIQLERAAVLSYKANGDTNAISRVIGTVSASSSEVIGLIQAFLPTIQSKGN